MASGLGFFSGAESDASVSAVTGSADPADFGSIEAGVGFKVVVLMVLEVDRPSGDTFMLVDRLMLVVWISGCGLLQQQEQAALVFDSQWPRRARSR